MGKSQQMLRRKRYGWLERIAFIRCPSLVELMCWLYRRKSCGNLRRNFMTALPFTIRQTKTTKPTSQGSKACLNAVTIAKGNRLAMTVNVSGVFLWRPNCQLYKVTGITKKIATRNSKPRFDSFVLAVHAPVRKKNRDKIQLVIPMIFINIFRLMAWCEWPEPELPPAV